MGWDPEKVRRYAEPLLAERAYIAERALAVEVRKGVLLSASAEEVLTDDGVDPESVAWDAYRREDGKWIVSARYARGKGTAHATWTFDNSGSNLHALDETARHLMGVSGGSDALASNVDDEDELVDFITDAVAVVDDAEIIDALRESAHEATHVTRPHLVAVPSEKPSDDQDDQPAAVIESVSYQETIAIEIDEVVEVTEQADAPEAKPKKTAKKAARPKGRRASVPSWDEILFGASKDDA